MAAVAVHDWPTIIDEVCEWLASGGTIRDYSRQDGKPRFELIHRHIAKDAELVSRIARARSEGADAIAEEALAIADDSSGDTIEGDGDHGPRMNSEWVQRSKLRFEARMRLLAKWNSGRYGDRQQVEHSGKIGLDALIAQTAAQKPPAVGGD